MTELSSEWYLVINADQRRSRSSPDRVPQALETLTDFDCVLAPERTVGDEIQLLSRAPEVWAQTLKCLTKLGGWRLGAGIGPIELPLPRNVRAARGPAFHAARLAVEQAHADAEGLALASPAGVVGAADYAGGDPRGRAWGRAHATSSLLHHLWSRRSTQGWDVIDVIESAGTGRAAAEHLNISASAVSQRLRAAGWHAGQRGEELLDDLVAEALGPETPAAGR